MKCASLVLALITVAACNADSTTAPVAVDAGVVYVLSNQSDGNAVLAYQRAANGALSAAGSFATGGAGTGGSLQSQSALAFSDNGEFLFAVNAGSNTVSMFRVGNGALTLLTSAPSGGERPVSLTARQGVLYVLHGGGSGNIAGLRYTSSGQLSPIANSSQPLSTGSAGPAQIEFTPNGDRLIVTERSTSTIGSYPVNANGVAGPGTFVASSGQTPYGFARYRDVFIVSEAAAGADNASTASSFRVGADGRLSLISASVPIKQTAACWFAVTPDGRYAFAANAGSSTITGFRVSTAGALERLVDSGVSADIGAGTGPADLAVSPDGRFLYSRNGRARTISVMRIGDDGSLTVLAGDMANLPSGAVGLAAR